MMFRENQRGADMADDLLRFSRQAFSATGLALSWLSSSQAPQTPRVSGMSETFLREYFSRGVVIDPFLACIDSQASCHTLWQLRSEPAPAASINAYAAFLAKHGYHDEMDVIFTIEGTPLAVLSLFGEQRFQFNPGDNAHLHEFLSSYIACHPFATKWRRQRVLQNTFELTPREIDVVEQVREGKTNSQIAAALGVSLTTVKTHVARALDKVDAPSRSALAALANQL